LENAEDLTAFFVSYHTDPRKTTIFGGKSPAPTKIFLECPLYKI